MSRRIVPYNRIDGAPLMALQRRTKRLLLWVGLPLLVLLGGLASILAATFLGRTPIADGFPMGRVRLLADGIVGVGVIDIGDRHVALVDAGNDATGQKIRAELARRGLDPGAVSAILLTHGHPDHIAAVKNFPNATVMALAAEVPLVEGRAGAKGPVARLVPVRATGIHVGRALADGEHIPLGDTIVDVFALPGHTAGSAAYLVDGVLFVGDSVAASTGGTLIGTPWIFSDSQSQNRAALVALDARLHREHADVRAIVPAHSGPMTSGLAPLDAFVAAR